MASEMFITGEWGSVAMKLDLCVSNDLGLRILESTTGPGILSCPDPEAAFFNAIQGWLDRHGAMPVILAGMIGSNIGWRDSGYVSCPADAATVADALTTITSRGINIHFSPGLECQNIFGLPDVIRGEEMQVFGWLANQATDSRRIVCLPGRHTKWLVAEGQTIVSFFTAMTGELEDLLLTHGLLGKGVDRSAISHQAFVAGVGFIAKDPTLSLGHALFSTRGRLVLGEHSATEAASFLRGVLIGADVRDSVHAHRERGPITDPLAVLGHGTNAELYLGACDLLGLHSEFIDTTGLAVDGLASLLSTVRSPA